MLKKKPLNTNEKGYRDNLIWENIISLVSAANEDIASKPEMVFVTNNLTDFISGDQLNEDLLTELKTIIESYLDDEYVGKSVGHFEFPSSGDYSDDYREINAYHENFKIQNLTVKKLSTDAYVMDARINIETELEFFVDKSEYYSK